MVPSSTRTRQAVAVTGELHLRSSDEVEYVLVIVDVRSSRIFEKNNRYSTGKRLALLPKIHRSMLGCSSIGCLHEEQILCR